MRTHSLLSVAIAAFAVLYGPSAAQAVLIGADDYDGTNFGLGAPTNVGGSGGSFIAGSIDGNSFGTFSGGGLAAFVRTIDGAPLFATKPDVTLTLSTRFNVPNSGGQKGFNLKNDAAGAFADNQLISVQMLNTSNTTLFVTDGSGGPAGSLDFGGTELRGAIIDFTLELSTVTGDYTLNARTRSGATASTVLGTLANPGDFVPRAIGLAHGGASGFGNDVFFDNLAISAIPEVSPATAGAILACLGCAGPWRRR